MKNIHSLYAGTCLMLASSAASFGLSIEFAHSNGGGINFDGEVYKTEYPTSYQGGGDPLDMMKVLFDTNPLGTSGASFASIFSTGDQFRFQLYFDKNNTTSSQVQAWDMDATPATNTNPAIVPPPVSAGSVQWAIQDYKNNMVYNSLLRGTVQEISLNQVTGEFAATLKTDGSVHWYYGNSETSLNDWGLNGYVYVSGTLVQDSSRPAYYHNDAAPVDHTLHFSFGVPDRASSGLLLGLGLLSLCYVRFSRRQV